MNGVLFGIKTITIQYDLLILYRNTRTNLITLTLTRQIQSDLLR
jgi:hypothetical protein